MGGSEFSQLLTADVMGVLANGATRPVVRKKAALCLLRLIRKAPPDAEIMQVGAPLALLIRRPCLRRHRVISRKVHTCPRPV